MKNFKAKDWIEVGLILSAVGAMYLILKARILNITAVDKANKAIKYKWKGEEYTWNWAGYDNVEVTEQDGSEFVIAEKVMDPLGVRLYFYQSFHNAKGEKFDKVMAKDNASFS
jgi:hypothetical protein